MADLNNNPNARYDSGPNAAGCGRVSSQATLNTGTGSGYQTDGTIKRAPLRAGDHVAGASKNNTGPNVAGGQRSVNNK